MSIFIFFRIIASIHGLKLGSRGAVHGNNINRVDLSIESKLIASALTETQNFIYSNEIKTPKMDFKVFLQSKVLRRLQGAIDRWMSQEDILRDVVISDSYQQVFLN